jgi:ferric-dicitrate binding protein FerR (iron transport regulator)
MEETIIKYLRGEATEEEKKQLWEWLSVNEENKIIFSQLRDIWIASGRSPAASQAYIEQMYDRFLQETKKKERELKSNRQKSFWTQIAAAICIGILFSALGYYLGWQRYKNGEQTAVVMNHFMMGKDSKGSITLPDGTLVWLHSESKLTYPQVFTKKERRVKLEGEGFFEVSKNRKKPFIVESGDMIVQVLGTQFNMKNYANKNLAETTLLSGKVEVTQPSTNRKFILHPNQKLLIDSQSTHYKIEQVDGLDYIVWINDKITFTNEKLSDILFKMERWYNIDIECQKDVDLNQRLSFTIRREVEEEIFKVLEWIAPIRCTINKDKVVIESK